MRSLVAVPPALFDIIAEYVFHGLFIPLTVSVIVAAVIVLLALAKILLPNTRARVENEDADCTAPLEG